MNLPPPAEFLWQYIWSTPLAGAAAEVDEERRAALEEEFADTCRAFAPTGTLAAEVRMTTLFATK